MRAARIAAVLEAYDMLLPGVTADQLPCETNEGMPGLQERALLGILLWSPPHQRTVSCRMERTMTLMPHLKHMSRHSLPQHGPLAPR